jgi:hypothetical protein
MEIRTMLTMLPSLACAFLIACQALVGGQARAADPALPIVFVHGNGDTASLWITTIWRFESNSYPRDLLQAVDLRYRRARDVAARHGDNLCNGSPRSVREHLD